VSTTVEPTADAVQPTAPLLNVRPLEVSSQATTAKTSVVNVTLATMAPTNATLVEETTLEAVRGRAIDFNSDNGHMMGGDSTKSGKHEEKVTSEEPFNFVTMPMTPRSALVEKERPAMPDNSKIFFNDEEDEDLSNISMDDDMVEATETIGKHLMMETTAAPMNGSAPMGCMMNGKVFKVSVFLFTFIPFVNDTEKNPNNMTNTGS
jgi:hypothetical protein